MRAVYRTLEPTRHESAQRRHAALDAAVLEAYGFSVKKDLLAQLLELNLAVAAKIEAGETVTAPGVPPEYPEPAKLVTEDCVRRSRSPHRNQPNSSGIRKNSETCECVGLLTNSATTLNREAC